LRRKVIEKPVNRYKGENMCPLKENVLSPNLKNQTLSFAQSGWFNW